MILIRTNVYPDLPNIYFFGLKGCAENKTLFEKIYFFLPLLPIFLKKFGPPFHLGALGNCLIDLVEGPALVSSTICFLLLLQLYHAQTLKCFSPYLATKNSYLLLLVVSVNQRLKYEIFVTTANRELSQYIY